jgi:hypothetical protein
MSRNSRSWSRVSSWPGRDGWVVGGLLWLGGRRAPTVVLLGLAYFVHLAPTSSRGERPGDVAREIGRPAGTTGAGAWS